MNKDIKNSLKWLRENWEDGSKAYCAERLPPTYFALLEWLATAPSDEVFKAGKKP